MAFSPFLLWLQDGTAGIRKHGGDQLPQGVTAVWHTLMGKNKAPLGTEEKVGSVFVLVNVEHLLPFVGCLFCFVADKNAIRLAGKLQGINLTGRFQLLVLLVYMFFFI